MRNSSGADRLTVTGDYAGGGSVYLDVDLARASNDMLIVGGNLTGPRTDVYLRASGGLQKVGRLQVVSAANQAVTDHFTFHAPASTDAVVFRTETENGNFYLLPEYSGAAPVYEGYLPALATASRLPSLNQRLGARLGQEAGGGIMIQGDGEGDFADDPDAKGSTPVWAYVSGGRSFSSGSNSNTGARQETRSWQFRMGIDGTFSENDGGRTDIGLSSFFGNTASQTLSGVATGQIGSDVYGLAASATWFGTNGFYLDGQLQAALYSSDLFSSSHGMLAENNRGWSTAASIEAGRRFDWAHGYSATAEAQVLVSRTGFERFVGPLGGIIESAAQDSAMARFGSQFEKRHVWAADDGIVYRSEVYGFANLYHHFGPQLQTRVGEVDLAGGADRWTSEVGIGGNFGRNDDLLSIFGEISITAALDQPRHNYGFSGKLGMKVSF